MINSFNIFENIINNHYLIIQSYNVNRLCLSHIHLYI